MTAICFTDDYEHMEQSDNILKVENLKKYFPVRSALFSALFSKKRKYIPAVDDVSFCLKKQEILGLVGESGCGKSTLGRLILCLIPPTSGRIFYQDTELTSLKKKNIKAFRRKMQMIFQDPFASLNPRRTVADTLKQTVRIHGLAKNRAEESELLKHALEEVGLKPADDYRHKYPAGLSGGQLQRVSIARVLMLQPGFIIADESVSMLDVSVRGSILNLLLRMKHKFGISFIYITHDLVTARHICDRIAIMYLGKIVEIGSAEDIVSRPRHPYTRALIAAVPIPDPRAKLPELPLKDCLSALHPECDPLMLSGCSFYPRCVFGTERCRQNKPELVADISGHAFACHLKE